MTEERKRERQKDFDAAPTIDQIIEQHPNEFKQGVNAAEGAENPYPQSFHFQLTVNDAKHIAWREGNKRRDSINLPAFDQNRTGVAAFMEYVGIMFHNQSRRQSYARYGPENVKRLEDRFARAYKEVYPGLPVPALFDRE